MYLNGATMSCPAITKGFKMERVYIETTNCFAMFSRTDAAKMIQEARKAGKNIRRIIGGYKF